MEPIMEIIKEYKSINMINQFLESTKIRSSQIFKTKTYKYSTIIIFSDG